MEPGLEQEFLSPSFMSSLLEPLSGVSNQPGMSRWHEHLYYSRKSFTPSKAWPQEVISYAEVLRTGLQAKNSYAGIE